MESDDLTKDSTERKENEVVNDNIHRKEDNLKLRNLSDSPNEVSRMNTSLPFLKYNLHYSFLFPNTHVIIS